MKDLQELEQYEQAFVNGQGVQVLLGSYNQYWTDITIFDNIKKFLARGYKLRIKPQED